MDAQVDEPDRLRLDALGLERLPQDAGERFAVGGLGRVLEGAVQEEDLDELTATPGPGSESNAYDRRRERGAEAADDRAGDAARAARRPAGLGFDQVSGATGGLEAGTPSSPPAAIGCGG